ncbi:unnamed protein product [Fraxinus pennsylvanica]|uniref:Ubiquitin-like protease family profile domain-containing protein n=1 Tax=Fraxinus pennsylvanica TaxID=56036 RepID=A0AAD2DK05_9LAMI|nr:unnamed protein product [Fraxinus pennsylvanica]
MVFVNDHSCYSDQRIQEEASPHCNLVPDLMHRFGIGLQRPEFARVGPLDYERMSRTELPQGTQDGHCGLFMVKYVECILAGIPVNCVTFDRMPFFRKKLVIDFFHKEFYFEKDQYIDVAEAWCTVT